MLVTLRRWRANALSVNNPNLHADNLILPFMQLVLRICCFKRAMLICRFHFYLSMLMRLKVPSVSVTLVFLPMITFKHNSTLQSNSRLSPYRTLSR